MSFNMWRFFLLLFISSAFGQKNRIKSNPQSIVQKFVQDSDLEGSSISFCLMDTKTDAIIFEYDKDRKLIPASTQKLITCATTLKYLGSTFRYVTPFEWNGYFLNDSVFVGNIMIKGFGDPSFGSPIYKSTNSIAVIADTLYRILERQCIKEIQGEILINSDFIKDIPENPEWLYYDIGNYYGAGIYGFNVLENSAYVSIEKAVNSKQAVITNVFPSELQSSFSNQIKIQYYPEESNELFAVGNSNCDQFCIYGLIKDTSEYKVQIRAAISKPYEAYQSILFNQLTERGIRFIRSKSSKKSKSNYQWYTHYSPPLDNMIRYTLKTSNNLYCESFVHLLGNKINASTDRSAALKSLNTFWNDELDEKKKIKMVDGSGLSRKNKMSSESMCRILNRIAINESTDKLLDLISDVSAEGSLANYFSGSNAPLGKLLLKSGSMEGVRAYAGYIQYDKKLYSIAIFINQHELKTKVLSSKISNLFIQLDKYLKTRNS